MEITVAQWATGFMKDFAYMHCIVDFTAVIDTVSVDVWSL